MHSSIEASWSRLVHRCLFLLLVLAVPIAGAAQSADIKGPVSRAALVELFTSEGCSSCPPAEKWLNGLEDRADLWSRVVPVAFHVDYWDYIGWPDRFAAREHSRRQQTYRDVGHLKNVYTPGLVLAGKEWRGWFRDRTLVLPDNVDVGSISVNVRDGRFEARFEPAVDVPESIELHVARLGFDFVTQVEAGENRGRELRHDFVVLGWSRHALKREGEGFGAQGKLPSASAERQALAVWVNPYLPSASNPAERQALAVWVSVPGDPYPIQAAGDWLGS